MMHRQEWLIGSLKPTKAKHQCPHVSIFGITDSALEGLHCSRLVSAAHIVKMKIIIIYGIFIKNMYIEHASTWLQDKHNNVMG